MVSYKNYLVLFGGIRELTHERNDVWVFNVSSEKWDNFEKASSVRNLKKKKVVEKSPSIKQLSTDEVYLDDSELDMMSSK